MEVDVEVGVKVDVDKSLMLKLIFLNMPCIDCGSRVACSRCHGSGPAGPRSRDVLSSFGVSGLG